MAYDTSKLVKLGQLKTLALKVNDVLGSASDASSAVTVYGARALAAEKVASITAGDAIEVSTSSPNSTTAPKVSVVLSSKTGNDLSFANGTGEDGGIYYKAPAVSVVKKGTANDDYAASYQVTVGGTAVGVDIDIPKDYLVKSAAVDTVVSADKQTGGKFENNSSFAVGDKYLDFVVNTKADGDSTAETDTHIYLNVKDLAHVYSAGNGIQISGSDEVSVKIDSANARGLSAGADGLALALVTPDTYSNGTKTADGTAGAMSSADKYKLDHALVDTDIATDAEVTEMMTEVFGA